MPLTNTGRDFLAGSAIGVSAPLFNNANAYIGIGDSTVAFIATQTDLQAAANKIRKPMDVGYPTITGNVLAYRATYGPNDANWAWQEWAVFNASAAGVMLQRMVEYNGTKLVGQSWIFEADITVQIGA